MSYPDAQSFEPSNQTRIAWYKTRKSTTSYGPVHLPGLFSSDGFSTDQIFFIMAMIVELAAVVVTIRGGMMMKTPIFIGSIVVVVLFLVLDYVGILFHHDQAGNRALWRNEILIPQEPEYLALLRRKLKKRTLKEDFGVLFLFLSGILKILAIAALNKALSSTIIIVLFSLFYIIVMYIHANHTGFWLAEFTLQRKIKKDHQVWSEGNGNSAQIYVHQFSSPFSLGLAPGQSKRTNRQGLTCISKNQNDHVFKLDSVGLMWDTDVAAMCMGLQAQERAFLAIECLQLQLIQTTAMGYSATLQNKESVNN
jgi:hypothetical protein